MNSLHERITIYNIFFKKDSIRFKKTWKDMPVREKLHIFIVGTLRDPEIVRSFPTSSVKFPVLLLVTCKLTTPISTKFFNFNKFVDDLDLDLFLKQPSKLPSKCNNPFLLVDTTNT